MDAAQKVQLARWFNARGIRMMKCAGHVESCAHYKAFKALADGKFAERDRLIDLVRVEMGRPKVYSFVIVEQCGSEYAAEGFDELSAGSRYEQICEQHGLPIGDYRVVKRRDRL